MIFDFFVYFSSSYVGVPKVKRDKYSVFNFLSATPTTSEAETKQATQDKPQQRETVQAIEAPPLKDKGKSVTKLLDNCMSTGEGVDLTLRILQMFQVSD